MTPEFLTDEAVEEEIARRVCMRRKASSSPPRA